MRKKVVDIISLGCSKNLVDSEKLMRQLVACGYEVEHDPEEPKGSIAVINTCGFIGDAKEESVNTILEFAEAKEEGRIEKLFVMGCLSERYLKDLEAEIPQVVADPRMQGEKTAAFLLFRSVPAVEQPVALGDGLQRDMKLAPFLGFQMAVELRRMYPRPPWCVVAVRSVENLLERVAGGGQSSEVRPRGRIPAVVVVEAVDCTVVGGVRLFVGVFQVPVEQTVVGSHCAGVDG